MTITPASDQTLSKTYRDDHVFQMMDVFLAHLDRLSLSALVRHLVSLDLEEVGEATAELVAELLTARRHPDRPRPALLFQRGGDNRRTADCDDAVLPVAADKRVLSVQARLAVVGLEVRQFGIQRRRHAARERLADDLGCRVAEDALRAGIPTQNLPIQGRPNNRVVRGGNDGRQPCVRLGDSLRCGDGFVDDDGTTSTAKGGHAQAKPALLVGRVAGIFIGEAVALIRQHLGDACRNRRCCGGVRADYRTADREVIYSNPGYRQGISLVGTGEVRPRGVDRQDGSRRIEQGKVGGQGVQKR